MEAGRRRQALVVEADHDVARLLQVNLEHLGYTVALACDGTTGLRVARAGKLRLVITCIDLPETNGFELLRSLKGRASTRHVPVIVITARHAAADLVRAWKLGASYFLEKPFELRELLAVVRRVAPLKRALDIMTKQVVTAFPHMKVDELAGLLADRRISGVPVVDANGDVIGIATEADILSRKRSQDTVGLIMTTQVISVGEDASLDEIADLLSQHKIKRVPVLRAGRLVGIVSRADVVDAIADRRQEHRR